MSPDDGLERILLAVDHLATSAAPIQQRLRDASEPLGALDPRAFNDPEDGARLQQIKDALSSVHDPTLGDMAATALAMSDQEAVAVARMIVALHRAVFPWR